MNRSSAVALVAVIFAWGAAREAGAQNVLANPGFEAGLTGWTGFGAQSVSSPVRTGVGAIRVDAVGGFSVPVTYQSFPAAAGQIWDFQGYTFAENPLPATATFAIVKIVFYDAETDMDLQPASISIGVPGSVEFPGATSDPTFSSASPTGQWIFSRTQATAPVGTDLVTVFTILVDESPATVYFDDLRAKVVSAPTRQATWNGAASTWTSANWSTPNFPNNGNAGFNYDATINSGTITLNQNITVDNFTLNAGTLTAASNFTLTVNDQMNWTGGTMSGSGQTIIPANGTLTFSGGLHFLQRLLTNNGATTWTDGDLGLHNGTFQNNGTFNVNSAGLRTYYGSNLGGVNAFNNAGTFVKQGAGTVQFAVNQSGVAFNNSGTVDVQQGTLNLATGGTHTGDFTIAAGASLALGGTHTFAAGSDISGGQNLTFESGTSHGLVTTSGAVAFTGNMTFNNSVTVGSAAFSAGTTVFNGALNLTGPLTIAGGTANLGSNSLTVPLIMSDGVLTGSGNVTVSGATTWTGGTMSGSGQTRIPSDGTLSMSGGPHNLNRLLVNDGTATWTGGNITINGGTFQNNGSFTVNMGAFLTASSSGTAGAFNNADTFTKQGTGTTLFTNGGAALPFNNSGTVNVQAGVLRLESGGIHTGNFIGPTGATLVLVGSHSLAEGADITGGLNVNSGTGSITTDGVINTTGTLSLPAGTMTMNGPVTAGIVNLSGGTGAFNGVTSIGFITMTGGTLSGSGNVTLTSPHGSTWARGTMSGSGQTTVAVGTALAIYNDGVNGDPVLARTLVNNGDVHWHTNDLNYENAMVQNYGVFTGLSNESAVGGGGLDAVNVFNNAGTFIKAGNGTITRFIAGNGPGVVFNNMGTVDVQAAVLSLESGVTQHVGSALTGGVWKVRSGGTLEITTGVDIATNLADVTLEGPGSIFAKLNNLVDNQGSLTITNGRDFSRSVPFSNTGTITVGAGSTFTVASLNQIASGQLTAGGWHLGPNAMLDVQSGANITTNFGDVSLDAGATFAQIDALVDNRGGFAIRGGRNFTAAGAFTNRGRITVGATSTFTASAGFTQTAAGSLGGTGTVRGNLTSAGAVRPGASPGILTIQGDYVQQAAGVLEIEVGGLAAGTEHDRLDVIADPNVAGSGKATLAGRLDVRLINNFAPAVNNEIEILTAAAGVTGRFDAVFVPSSSSLPLELTYNQNNVLVRFVAPIAGNPIANLAGVVEWSDPNIWSTPVPETKSVVNLTNDTAANLTVNVAANDAFVHQLTVSGGQNTTTVAIPTGRFLSSTAGVAIQDAGVVALAGGTLSTSQVAVESGGLLKGNGALLGDLVNVVPADAEPSIIDVGFSIGHLDVGGDFIQAGAGTLAIEVADGGVSDTITVAGAAKLGGVLNIQIPNDGSVQPGDRFEILTAGSLAEGVRFDEVHSFGNPNLVARPVYLPGEVDPAATAAASAPAVTARRGFDGEVTELGDMNWDFVVNAGDVSAFALALRDPRTYEDTYFITGSEIGNMDHNNRGLDFDDIDDFAARLAMSVPQLLAAMRVPEPTSVGLTLAALGSGAGRALRRRTRPA